MKILAVSSGKGGVGKTTLTLNIARQLSLAGFRTLIIDFDIHNKGATCLFMDKVAKSQVQSITGVMGECKGFDEKPVRKLAEQFEILDLEYAGKLFLIPAARPDEMVKWETFVCDVQSIVKFFGAFISAIAERHRIDVVLIDCYGGVDTLTISAAGIADDFIIINEPDVITFAGTLLLYKQLERTYGASDHPPRVHFVINRISGRHSFRFLHQEYQEHLSELAVDRTVLAYLPFDKLVFDTFGDYPFFSELLPNGLYAKKIRELIARLWPEPQFVRLTAKSARRRQRIYQATAENPFADPERIFKVWKTAPGWALLPVTALILLYVAPGKDSISFFALRATFYMSLVFVSGVILVGVLFEPFQITRWLLRRAKYERRRGKLIFGSTVTSHIRALSDFALSCMPAGIGLLCFCAVLLIAASLHLHYPFRNVSIWQKQIEGFYPTGDYSHLILADGASVKPGSDLSNSSLDEADLTSTILPKIKLNNASLRGVKLDGAKLVGDELNCANVSNKSRLGSADLSASAASRADFSDSDAIGAKFWAADLSQARFKGAVLYLTDFRQSNLTNADFSGAIIKNTQFDGADLTGADFRKADFSYIDAAGQAKLFSQLEHQGATLEDKQRQTAMLWESFMGLSAPCQDGKLNGSDAASAWWWCWTDKSKPAHLVDFVNPRIHDLAKRLAKKSEADAQLPDPRLLHQSDFTTEADLIELLLIRGGDGLRICKRGPRSRSGPIRAEHWSDSSPQAAPQHHYKAGRARQSGVVAAVVGRPAKPTAACRMVMGHVGQQLPGP